MPWRPARIANLHPEAAGVINQLFRETNGRIDDINKAQRPRIKSTSKLVFGTIPAGQAVEAVVNIPGANTSGVAHVSPGQGVTPGSPHLMWSSRVVANGQVAVRVLNPTGSPLAVNTIPWNIFVEL